MTQSNVAQEPHLEILESKYQSIFNHNIHYLDAGQGEPILFLHGIPASSYLWRNIISPMSDYAHCIAPDLIGTGKSDKPNNISYKISDHFKYIEAFIKELDLKNITLVLHGLGSIIGFNYAMKYPGNIKGIAFYESYIGEIESLKKDSLPFQHINVLLKDAKKAYDLIMNDAFLIKKIFDTASLRKLTKHELQIYSKPFRNTEDRKILWQYFQEALFGHEPKEVAQTITHYTEWLLHTKFPKLMLYSVPGFITTIKNVQWCKSHLQNLTVADIGEGLHFVQEYNPTGFSAALKNWFLNKVNVVA